MDKTDILNLLWMALVTDSYCLWRGNSHVTWKTGCSLECTVQMCISNQECAHALPLDKGKLHLSAFPSATLMPYPSSSSRHGRQSRELHLVFQCSLGAKITNGRAQRGEQRGGKLWMTSTGPNGVLMNISNLWVKPVMNLRTLCASSKYKTTLVTPRALQTVCVWWKHGWSLR